MLVAMPCIRSAPCGASTEEFEQPRFDVVHRSDNPDRTRAFQVGQNGTAAMDVCYCQLDILACHRIYKTIVLGRAFALILGRLHGRADLGEQPGEISELRIVDRALDRATTPCARSPARPSHPLACRQLHTPEDIVVGDIAGHARIEAVSDA